MEKRETTGRGRGARRQAADDDGDQGLPRVYGRGRSGGPIVEVPAAVVEDLAARGVAGLQIGEAQEADVAEAARVTAGRGRTGRGRGGPIEVRHVGGDFSPGEVMGLAERAAIPPPFPVAAVEPPAPEEVEMEPELPESPRTPPQGVEHDEAMLAAAAAVLSREESPRSTHEEEQGTAVASGSIGSSAPQRLQFQDAPKVTAARSEPVIRRGNKGAVSMAASNYMSLLYDHKTAIHEYHVCFEPVIDNIRYLRKGLDQFQLQLGPVRNFDGAALFLPKKLDPLTVLNGVHPVDASKPLKVEVRYVKEKEAHELVHFFNILFKKIMRITGFTQLRDNYYNLKEVKTLPQHRLEVWPGFAVAVDEREGGLMICLDASHRVLRTDTVLEYISAMDGQSQNWKLKVSEFLIGKIVLTRYNNMCYKIDDVMWGSTPLSTFPKGQSEISYVEYYKQHHGKDIRNKSQPLLLSKIKPRRNDPNQEEKMVALVPELCFITGLTDELRSNFTVMKDLGDHTRLAPAQRKVAIEKYIQNVNGNPEAKQVLSDWNLTLDSKPVSVECRQMAAPKLTFGKLVEVQVRADFSKESGNNCHDPREIRKYLLLSTQRDSPIARRFHETYRQVAQTLHIRTIEGCQHVITKGMTVNDFRKAIVDNLKPDIQFLVCILPQQRDDMYGMVKKTCVAEMGIPSQVILTKTLGNEKRFRSVLVKVALQINCKLGGAIWSLNMPKTEEVMFVGIDVAHDPLKRLPSALALVASLNNEMTRYFSSTKMLKVHQEVTDSLKTGMTELLNHYLEERGVYPGRIVVYRDGGNVSGLRIFRDHEAVQIKEAINALCPGVKFSFVVVQKRIAQRFFQVDRSGCKNPEPGTVIDHSVTNRDVYDFFVVSQLVRQGTVTPTHYCVVEDTHNSSPDLMQKYAYATSFMYFNWPGTVRVPAVTQYAHKLCSLIHSHVKQPPNQKLVKSLYYL